MARGMGFNAWGQHIQGLHSLVIAVGVILGYLHRLQLFQACLLLNLVVTLIGIMLQMAHIGNVTHIAHFITQMLQVTEKNVESDSRAGMSQMRITIDGRSADIHSHVWCMQRLETFFLPMQCIVNQKCLFHIF